MDILLLLVLYVGLPLVTAVLLGMWMASKYRVAVEKVRREPFWEQKYTNSRPKFIVFLGLLTPAVIYGIVFIILYMIAPETEDHHGRVALIGGYVMGTAGVISLIGQGLVLYKGLTDIPRDPKIDMVMPKDPKKRGEWRRKNKKAMEKSTFPKHLVVSVLPHSVVVYAFLITLFLFIGAGILDGSGEADTDTTPSNETETDDEFSINVTNVDEAETIGLIFAASCVPSLLSGYLPSRVKGDILDKRIFVKKIILGAIGIIPAMFGMVTAITMMVLNGMIGG